MEYDCASSSAMWLVEKSIRDDVRSMKYLSTELCMYRVCDSGTSSGFTIGLNPSGAVYPAALKGGSRRDWADGGVRFAGDE